MMPNNKEVIALVTSEFQEKLALTNGYDSVLSQTNESSELDISRMRKVNVFSQII